MFFALVLVCVAVLAWLLSGALHRAPSVFYVIALIVDIVYAAGATGLISLPTQVWASFIFLIQKCTIALALFVVVMFIGALSTHSKIGIRMRSARAELSILACILTIGHIVAYLAPFASRVLSGGGSGNVTISFAIAIVMLVLMVALGVTSFEFVKRRMKADSWKKLQRLAYVFFGLTYVHLALMLLPSAVSGGAAAVQSVAVYTVVFLAYAVARVVRWRIDTQGPSTRSEDASPSTQA